MNAALEYRRRAIETASPVGLVALLYGGAVTSLRKGMAAIDANDVEGKVQHLNHVLKIVAELQGTLNFEKGGEVARSLEKFYVVMRSRVLEASIKSSKPILEELVKHFTSLKEAWEEVDRQNRTSTMSGIAAMPPRPQTVQPLAMSAR